MTSQPPQSPPNGQEFGNLPDLPAAYDENRVYLVAIDPYSALAFWDFSEVIEKALIERVPPPQKKAIRVFDVTKLDAIEGALSWDIPLDLESTHLIFKIGQPGREFMISLGYVGADNRFHELGQSNRIALPRVAPTKKRAQRFGHWDSSAGGFVEEEIGGDLPASTESGISPANETPQEDPNPRQPEKIQLPGPARHWLNFSRRTPADFSTPS